MNDEYIRSDRAITRRSLLLAAGIGMTTARLRAADPTDFKFAFCNESMQGMTWAEQCRLVADAGYAGVEIAAFTLVKNTIDELTPAKRAEMVRTLKEHGLQCAGLHWLLAPPPAGLHWTTPDRQVREKTWAYFHKLIDFCGDMHGPIMVFGSPKQRNAAGISVEEATRNFAEGLVKMADHAKKRGVTILIESLDHTQTDVVNTMEQAAGIIRAINHSAIRTMFDFHNTVDEKKSFSELIIDHFTDIRHVHVQEMDGQYLGAGTGRRDFKEAFQTLKSLRYSGWVSVEVFDFKPGPEKLARESIKVLRELAAG